jgi:cell volume regulation protein A
MTVAVLFALIGGVILLGFLANLLFRVTKIPSVLLLIGIGVVLGPVTGLIRSDALLAIAPFFGAAALLVILFEGGLELEIAHVIRHAPRTALLAVAVFGLSVAGVAAVAHFLLGFSLLTALMLGAVLGATSPAICLPVVSGLPVRADVKTVIKLESAIGEVLLIVTVVLLIEGHAGGDADALVWARGLARSLLVALLVSSAAGVLWSRLVGWMGHEPLAYMLTLGMVCLLYFVVEELGGSPAIAVLLFGLMLANMETIAGRIGPHLRELFGIDIRAEQFVLSQFMVHITAELSFLVRTFFFVYLGLLLDFSAFSWSLTAWALGMFALLLASRRVGIAVFKRGRAGFSRAELQTIMALQPRGLATAVVAFLPMQSGVPGTSLFPVYAFLVITLSNVYMTGGILLAQRRLRLEAGMPADEAETAGSIDTMAPSPALDGIVPATPVAAQASAASAAVRRPSPFSPASAFADEPEPSTFTDWMARFFGLRLADRETEYGELIRASYLFEPLFWVQSVLGAAICALGLILDQPAIIIGGALIVPLVRPVVAAGLALATGDLYLLVRLIAKLLGFGLLVVLLSALVVNLLPFSATTAEIAARMRPTILDFLVALFGGMSGAALIGLRTRAYHYLPGAVIAITLLPALCVMGFGLEGSLGGPAFRGGGLQFTANMFAAVLGASAILSLVGVPKAAQCASVRIWKEQELARPVVHAVFGRLRLQNLIGRTGSLRARLIVVGIFLLTLLIPLQSALNQLTREYRTRQAISRAQAVFDVPGRSSVVSSSFVLRDQGIEVRVQVATNALFTGQDIARFEERVSDQVGRPAHLDLVQTLSDVGQADTIRNMLFAPSPAPVPERARTVAESLQETRGLVERAVARLPLPERMHVLGIRSVAARAGRMVVELPYLADRELDPDARAVLVSLLAAQTGLGEAQLTLRWLPDSVRVRLTRAASILREDEPAVQKLRETLEEWPGLAVSLSVPTGMSPSQAETARKRVQELLAVSDLPADPPEANLDGRTVLIRVFATQESRSREALTPGQEPPATPRH